MTGDRKRIQSPETLCASDARLAAAALVGLALGILIVGQAHPEPRVTYFDIPLNTVLFILAGVAFASRKNPVPIRKVVFIASLPLLLLVASALWSPDVEAGIAKSANLYVSSLLAGGLFAAACATGGVRQTLVVLLALLTCLLAFALLVKSHAGFFDRTVPFGLNGPIVFGRFMGIAAVTAVFVLSGTLRIFAVLLFLLAVAWTESKGPMLSALLVLAAIALLEGRGFIRVIGPALIAGFLALLVVLGALLIDSPVLDRFVLVAFISDPWSAANYGSIGARMEAYTASVSIIAEEPFGVGAGGWASATGLYFLEYPHNFALEIASEMGLVLAPIVVLPFLAFLISPIREFRYLAFLLALAQQTSGDLLDSRMWLAISLASIAVRPTDSLRLTGLQGKG